MLPKEVKMVFDSKAKDWILKLTFPFCKLPSYFQIMCLILNLCRDQRSFSQLVCDQIVSLFRLISIQCTQHMLENVYVMTALDYRDGDYRISDKQFAW